MGSGAKVSRREFLVIGGAVGLGLAGCATGTGSRTPVKGGGPVAPLAPAPAGPKGTFKMGMAAEAPTFDFYLTTTGAARAPMVYNVVEALVGTTNDQKIIPGLAESWERTSPTAMRFKLRKGVKFHNGEPFNAEAVALAVATISSPALNSQVLGFISTLQEAKAVDEYTVDIITKEPDPILLRRLYFMSIMAPKAYKDNPKAMADAPIGTGPYRVKERRKGQAVILEAVADYYGSEKPTFQTVEFHMRAEPSTRVAALRSGEVDLIDNLSPELVKALDPKTVVVSPGYDTFLLRLDTKYGALKDKRIREAMAYAIDLDSIHQNIFLGTGASKPSGQMYNNLTFGWDPKAADHPYDPAKAKQLLKEAGAEGLTIDLICQSAARYLKDREVTEAIAFMLNQVGFKAAPKFIEYSEWLKVIFELNNPSPVITIGAGNELLDADRILDAYGTSKGRLSTYSSPRFDELMTKQRSELDPEKRTGILQQMAGMLRDDIATIPIAVTNLMYAKSPKLEFTPRVDGLLPLNRMKLNA